MLAVARAAMPHAETAAPVPLVHADGAALPFRVGVRRGVQRRHAALDSRPSGGLRQRGSGARRRRTVRGAVRRAGQSAAHARTHRRSCRRRRRTVEYFDGWRDPWNFAGPGRDRGTASRRRSARRGGVAGRGAGGPRNGGEVCRLRVVRLHPPPSRAPAAAAPRSLHAGSDRARRTATRSPTRSTTGGSTSARGRRAGDRALRRTVRGARRARRRGTAAVEAHRPMAAGDVHPRGRLSRLLAFRARVLSRCRVRRRDDAPARLRRARGVARARRGACRLARRAPRGQPVRDGANRPGLGPAASGRRAARRHRASSVRAGSRSLRPRLAAAMARSGSDRSPAPTPCRTGCCIPRRRPISPPGRRAVAELAPALVWREHFAAHGRLVSGVRRAELDAFLRWAESPGPFGVPALRRLRVAVVLTTAAIWLLILLHAAGAISAAWWLVPITLGMILSFATARWVHGEFNRANVGEHAFERYAGLFVHVTAAPRGAALLEDIQSRLGAPGVSAPACMRRLMRILGLAQLRAGAAIFHFIFQALTLWDFYVFFALDSWRREVGHRVRGWMAAVGELDALSAFAHIRQDNPGWCFPDVHEADAGAPIELRGRVSRSPADSRRSPRRQRRRRRSTGHAAADHRIEHVGEEHAASRHRPQRRARAGRRSGLCDRACRCPRRTSRRASASRIRWSTACPISWRRSRG